MTRPLRIARLLVRESRLMAAALLDDAARIVRPKP